MICSQCGQRIPDDPVHTVHSTSPSIIVSALATVPDDMDDDEDDEDSTPIYVPVGGQP